MEKIDKDFGKFLKIRRIQLDLTQQEVAERLGISHQSYSAYERGSRKLTLSTIIKLSEALAFKPGDFFDNYGK